MSNTNVQSAFSLQNVSKDFALPAEHLSSLKARVAHLFKKNERRVLHAVKPMDLEIKQGEFFGIVGRNGSGKSTLLKMLAGIILPSTGTVAVGGTVSPFLELGVGFNPELTARQNIYLNGAVLGMEKKEIEDRYDAIIHFAELEDFQEVKLKNFSSGMYVRLAFSVAIHAPTDILLMDEVLAVGDERFQEKCTKVFHDLKARGRTVILVSHDMGAISQFCDRVLVMERGKMLTVSTTKEAVALYHSLNTPTEHTSPLQEETVQETPTFPASISSVTYLNDQGEQISTLQSGATLRVRVEYQAPKGDVKNAGIALFQENNVYVFGTNTLLDAPDMMKWSTEGHFELTYTSLSLAPGTYSTQIGLFGTTDNDVLGFTAETPTFTVTAPTPYQGTTIFPHSWTFPS